MSDLSKIQTLGLIAVLLFLALVGIATAQDDEEGEVLADLKETRAEARETFTPELRAYTKKELPSALELLELTRKAAEARGATLETQFAAAELPVEIVNACKQLQDSAEHYPEEFGHIKKNFQLDFHARALGLRYRLSQDASEKGKLAQKLQEALEESFSFIQQTIEKERREASAELKRLERRVEDRKRYRDEIIQRRKAELLEDYDPFQWW